MVRKVKFNDLFDCLCLETKYLLVITKKNTQRHKVKVSLIGNLIKIDPYSAFSSLIK